MGHNTQASVQPEMMADLSFAKGRFPMLRLACYECLVDLLILQFKIKQ